MLATFNGGNDAIAGNGEEVGAAFALLSRSSDGLAFVVRVVDEGAIVGTGRVDSERAGSLGMGGSVCSCLRFKRDDGTKEPALVLGSFEFVALEDTVTERTVPFEFTFVGTARMRVVVVLLTSSPQHQSPIFRLLLSSKVLPWLWTIILCVLLFDRIMVISVSVCMRTRRHRLVTCSFRMEKIRTMVSIFYLKKGTYSKMLYRVLVLLQAIA